MKMKKQITAALCTAALTVCTLASVSASAANPGNITFYQPSDNERFTVQCRNWYGNADFKAVYRADTDDFDLCSNYRKSFRNYRCGDVNMDGKITEDDAQLALEIAVLNLVELNPLTHGFTQQQLWLASVTNPAGTDADVSDAQSILMYASSGYKKYSRIEDYIAKEHYALVHTNYIAPRDLATTDIFVEINIHTQPKWRPHYPIVN